MKESYRTEELTDAFFEAALDAALQPPSRGVVFWSWPHLAEQAAKQEVLELGRSLALRPGLDLGVDEVGVGHVQETGDPSDQVLLEGVLLGVGEGH